LPICQGSSNSGGKCEAQSNEGDEETRILANTNPTDTKVNAASRRGVRVCSANGTCENQEAWVAKSLTKSEALAGGTQSENA
jgi:hypothetical protein